MSAQEDFKKMIYEKERRLEKLRIQQAKMGIETPVHILTEVEDLESEIAQLKKEVRANNVLIIDDYPDVLNTLRGGLSDAGYDVHTAKNEAESLKAAEEHGPFGFAIVDVRLHGDDEEDESGLSLTLGLRQLNPQIQIIQLTGHILHNQTRRAMRDYGVIDYIEKGPDMVEEIIKTIRKFSK